MTIEQLFFELLQVAIGNRKSLSVTPTSREWALLYDMATKQALTGVCFVGMQRLSITPKPYTLNLPEALRLRWLGMAAKIQQRNQLLNAECVRLVKQLAHDGFHCCILKGQSNLVYYPEDLREARTPGDIDVLLRSMEEPDAIDLPIRYCQEQARLHGAKPPHVTYHHADLAWEGIHSTGYFDSAQHKSGQTSTEVEAHYRATFLCSPLRNWRLQNWLEENMPFGICDANCGETSRAGTDPAREETVEKVFPIPTVSYNAVYQLLHIYKHLFEGGIGLRQLLDYYFVLRALHIEQGSFADRTQSMAQWAEGMGLSVMSNEEIMHALSRFGMKKFAGAVMYVLAKVFANDNDDDNDNFHSDGVHKPSTINHKPWMICEPDEKEGKFLLNEIMQAGNFGKYDDRIKHGGTLFSHAIEKTKHNLRLLTHYPEEVLCEPFFRVYHWVWRKLELWRF